jgi:hypothetical protein
MPNDHLDAYRAVRARICAIATELSADDLATTVPACPDWTVHDLLAHNVAIPAAIGASRLPTDGDLQGWLDGLLAERAEQPVEEMVSEWADLDEVVGGVLSATPVLLDDIAVHEHDLRSAVNRPDHAAFDADRLMPIALEALAGPAAELGLGALVVESPEGTWRSHDAEPGWTIRTDAWEAFRAVSSRRSAPELRALPGDGDPEPFLAVIDGHLRLPPVSLREP